MKQKLNELNGLVIELIGVLAYIALLFIVTLVLMR